MKNMLGMPIKCHTSDLQVAFGIDTGKQYLNNCKAKFVKRLDMIENKILKYTIKNRVPNSLATHYFDRMEVSLNKRTCNKLK
jgi:hypothetical protein